MTKGALLFQIDPFPYRLAVEQTASDLDIAKAQLETQRRLPATQRSNAVIAADQTKSARENHDLASRTVERLRPLASHGYVPQQQLDQAQVLKGTPRRNSFRHRNRKPPRIAQSTPRPRPKRPYAPEQRPCDCPAASRRHDRTRTHNVLVVGLRASTGEMVIPSQSLFTLINTEEWFANANFRETDLSAIAIGDCATVFSLIDRKVPIKGVVQGLGWGVTDQDIINIPRSVPFVERSMNWVRVAQRFPVRVRIENPPQLLMRLGASAVVEIKHGAACR